MHIHKCDVITHFFQCRKDLLDAMLQRKSVDIRRRQSRWILETTLHRKIHRKYDRKISSNAKRHVRHQGPSANVRTVPQTTRNY